MERQFAESIRWWESKRPADWSEDQHLAEPTVNCSSSAEQALAQAVARWVAFQRRRAAAQKGELA
jgi:hypothetical protein